MSINKIVKSDGTVVPFEPEKLNKWASYASANEVEWSNIVLDAYRKCYDGCSTKDIQQAMISACVEKEDAKHLKMAGRLLIGSIYKEAHGGYKSIPTVKDFYKSMVEQNRWIEMDYSDEELDFFDTIINHEKNLSEHYSYTSLKQMRDKYIAQDLVSRKCFESPQFMFMGVAMKAMEIQPKDRRMQDVAEMYELLSDLKVNLSTPMLVNLRTPKQGLASCCVYTTNDTAESLATGDHIAYMMTCASAGIGSHLTTRSIGDPVRNGAVVHQGKLPYLRMIQSAVHANKQACYDDKTSVLTNTGFKLFKDLNDDDLVAQVHDDGTVDFVEPIQGFVYDYNDNLVNFNGGNGLEMPVTPNHTMIYSDLRGSSMEYNEEDSDDEMKEENKQFLESRADELVIEDGIAFKVSAYTRNRDSGEIPLKDLLMGYFMCREYEILENGNVLLQVEDIQENYALTKLLDKIGIGTKVTEEDTIEIDLKVTPDAFINSRMETFLTRASTSIINDLIEFINTMNRGNGQFVVREEYVEYMQAILSISGKSFTLDRNHRFDITEGVSSHIDATEFAVESYEYNGKVYCLEVPTNKLIVKRGELTLICGNSRGGANTTYFSVLDPEINDLIALKNPTTILQKRIRDIDYALNVNRSFVERVARNEEWYTISYFHAKDLHDAFYSSNYELFEELFEKYKDSPHAVKYKARELALKALTESVETGRLYIHYVDEANRHTPFKTDEGNTIYSSNLCVAPETEILTKDGYQVISTLKDKEVEVWNGEEWSNVTVRQTGEDRELLHIKFSNGTTLDVTSEHKFYVRTDRYYDLDNMVLFTKDDVVGEEEVRAKDLLTGSIISSFVLPNGEENDRVIVESVEKLGRIDDTYCATEPKRNRLIFNGIETGNCLEISISTKGFKDIQDLYSDDPEGEIGLCSLSSIVSGRVSEEEYEKVAYYTLLLVDNTIEIMDYPFPALRATARKRRNIGIGITNLAYDIASRGLSYTTKEGKKFIHKVAERHAYYLYKASLRLAKEKGNAEWMHKTKFPEGWLPIDTYKKTVDEVVENDLEYDWETLRQEIIKQGGIRNSTVTAIPPNESSSLLTNTTNSIYPIRSLRVIKTSGTNRNILLAPDYETLKDKYDIVWNMKSKDLIELYAIVQKFTDQGISSDLYVSYKDSQTVSSRDLLSDFIMMYRLGCKSRYYINSQSGVDAVDDDKAEIINTDDQCESCVL